MAGFRSSNASLIALQHLVIEYVFIQEFVQGWAQILWNQAQTLLTIWWDTLLLPWAAGIGTPRSEPTQQWNRESMRDAGVVSEGRKFDWRDVSLVRAVFRNRIAFAMILPCYWSSMICSPSYGQTMGAALTSIRQRPMAQAVLATATDMDTNI